MPDDGDSGLAPAPALQPAAPVAGQQSPAWLAAHRFLLPAHAEATHAAALEAARQGALEQPHPVRWSILRKVQAEDEARLQRGKKKRMRKLTTSKHINRTSYAALKVDLAMHILNAEIADQLRLRRHGGWV